MNAAILRTAADLARRRVIEAYGGKCTCCAESEPVFLTIDHIAGNGKQDRDAGKSGVSLYKALVKMGFPKENYRLMCFNCNLGRARNGGICPHERA